jgi:hypothetical protein
MAEQCPVCQQQTSYINHNPYTLNDEIGCSNCGVFLLSITSRGIIQNHQERHKISCLLRERSLKGMGPIAILSDNEEFNRKAITNFPIYTISEMISTFPESINERLDRTLLNLAAVSNYPGEGVSFDVSYNRSLFFTQTDNNNELFFLMNQLIQDELINGKTVSPTNLIVTTKGWNKIADLQRASSENSNQVFVAMWFDKEMDSVYENYL